MNIAIELPETLTPEQVSLIKDQLQARADMAIENVFGDSLMAEVFRKLRDHREFTGQSTESLLTETEQLRMEFGLNTGHAAESFAMSFGGDS